MKLHSWLMLFPVMKHRLSRAKNYLHFLMEYGTVYWNTSETTPQHCTRLEAERHPKLRSLREQPEGPTTHTRTLTVHLLLIL